MNPGSGIRAILRLLGADEDYNRNQRLAVACALAQRQLVIAASLTPDEAAALTHAAVARFVICETQ